MDLEAIKARLEETHGGDLSTYQNSPLTKLLYLDVPALVAEVERLRAEREVLKKRLETAHAVIDQLAPGAKFVSYAHQEGNTECPCNSCRFERDAHLEFEEPPAD